MKEIQNSLDVSLNLGFLGYMMYPFVTFVGYISSFMIDLGSVNVTCKGSQAPMELLINCFVLGMIVVIIESDFHVFQNGIIYFRGYPTSLL